VYNSVFEDAKLKTKTMARSPRRFSLLYMCLQELEFHFSFICAKQFGARDSAYISRHERSSKSSNSCAK
jgi:hypothetical protein